MKALKLFITEQNFTNKMWGDKTPAYPTDPKLLTSVQLKELADRVSSNLSPEFLYADGERPRAQVAKLRKSLMATKADLESLGQTVELY